MTTYYNYHCSKCGLDGILENETACPYCEEPIDEKNKVKIERVG